jgi:hypothetical protein
METGQKTQLQKANETLCEVIKPNVTAEDRRVAINELDVSRITVIRYLQGQVKKADTATRLIEFFRNRIKARDKAIA